MKQPWESLGVEADEIASCQSMLLLLGCSAFLLALCVEQSLGFLELVVCGLHFGLQRPNAGHQFHSLGFLGVCTFVRHRLLELVVKSLQALHGIGEG